MSAPHARAHETVKSMAMLPHEYDVMFEIEEDYWWYRGLRVLLDELTARYVAADGSSRILDAGCGTGKNLQTLLRHSAAWGVDISSEAIELTRRRGVPADRALVASLLELPFPDRFFDVAFSFDVICNIQNDVAAFEEIHRALKPGGRLITQLPAYRFLWSAHDVAVGHKHRYRAGDLRAKIAAAGFEVEALTYLNMTLFPLIALMRLARRPGPEGHARSDLTPLPGPLNAVLSALFTAEMRAAPRLRLPYGISLLAVARKVE